MFSVEMIQWLRSPLSLGMLPWLTVLGTVIAAAAAAVAAYASLRSARAAESTAQSTREMAEAEVRARVQALLAEVKGAAKHITARVDEAISEWRGVGAKNGDPNSSSIVQIVAGLSKQKTLAEEALNLAQKYGTNLEKQPAMGVVWQIRVVLEMELRDLAGAIKLIDLDQEQRRRASHRISIDQLSPRFSGRG